MVLGLQEGPVKPEVAGGLVYKDGHIPRAHQVYANDKETNWRGTEGSETEPTPSGHCDPIRPLRPHQATATGLIKMAWGWQMQGP